MESPGLELTKSVTKSAENNCIYLNNCSGFISVMNFNTESYFGINCIN